MRAQELDAPGAQDVRLLDLGVDADAARVERGQRAAIEVADARPLDRQDGVPHVLQRLQAGCKSARGQGQHDYASELPMHVPRRGQLDRAPKLVSEHKAARLWHLFWLMMLDSDTLLLQQHATKTAPPLAVSAWVPHVDISTERLN